LPGTAWRLECLISQYLGGSPRPGTVVGLHIEPTRAFRGARRRLERSIWLTRALPLLAEAGYRQWWDSARSPRLSFFKKLSTTAPMPIVRELDRIARLLGTAPPALRRVPRATGERRVQHFFGLAAEVARRGPIWRVSSFSFEKGGTLLLSQGRCRVSAQISVILDGAKGHAGASAFLFVWDEGTAACDLEGPLRRHPWFRATMRALRARRYRVTWSNPPRGLFMHWMRFVRTASAASIVAEARCLELLLAAARSA